MLWNIFSDRWDMETKDSKRWSLNPYCYGISSLTFSFRLEQRVNRCLNPYCYGISSLTWLKQVRLRCVKKSLNPYCYGISSLTDRYVSQWTDYEVLILIVMEYLLWPLLSLFTQRSLKVLILIVMEYLLWRVLISWQSVRVNIVLILIVMEYLLWLNDIIEGLNKLNCLNPYCYGISSLTYFYS